MITAFADASQTRMLVSDRTTRRGNRSGDDRTAEHFFENADPSTEGGENKEGTVPLSEHEQRLLDEIEQALYAEDPKFASAVRAARGPNRTRRLVVLCSLGILAGLGMVLIGLITTVVALSVIGFVVLVGSCGSLVQTLRNRSGKSSTTPAAAPGAARSGGLRSRMEDRLRRRFEQS